jgi:transposase
VLKRRNLTSPQRFRLRGLLRYNLKTVRAYLLKEDFQQFWEYQSPTWAAKFLHDWCQQVMRSRIEPMKKTAKTLIGHRELILNYFRAKKQFSSGVIEGSNNKAKLTRKAYGFRTFPVNRTRPVSRTGKTARAKCCPQILLTNQLYFQ